MAAHLCDAEIVYRLDSRTGEVIYGDADELDEIVRSQVYPTFFGTEIGSQFAEEYVWNDAIQNRVSFLLKRDFGEAGTPKSGVDFPGAILVWRLEQVIGDLIRVGDPALTLANPAQPIDEEQRTRDEHGRFVNAVAQEVRDDLSNPNISTYEIRQKRATRPEYAAAWNTVNTPEKLDAKTTPPVSEVRDFAEAYKSAPASALKMREGVYRVAGIPYSQNKFEELVTAASAAGLI